MAKKKDQAIILTEGLTKVFRDFWGHQRVIAVDDLDLEVRPHEVFGLLGPNGSGKSTTIKLLLGLLHITRGRAWILGHLPGEVKNNAHIGYLPEESYLYPFLNARETLDFYGRLFGLDRAERHRRIDSLLEMVGLSGVARRPIGEYSKGMIRRIGLAQALINDPDLLILDEPTSGLDPIGTRQIKDLVVELGRRGKTVLLCSHLLADVEDVCDRICILYGGKVQAQGTVQEMLAQQNTTQILTPTLSEETQKRIREIIRQEQPESEIVISTPRDRLEDVFLKIVSHAQAREIETSGAMMGGAVSDFLGRENEEKDQGHAVIEQLVAAEEPVAAAADESAENETVAVEQEQAVREEVLESLLETTPADLAVVGSPEDADDGAYSDSDLTTPVEMDRQDEESGAVNKAVIEDLLGEDRDKASDE